MEYSGTLKIITNTTLDPNGGFHGKDQILFVNFKGIGQTSGDEYSLTSSGGSESNFISDGGPIQQTSTSTLHIRDGISEKGKITIQFTVNANGEVTVDDANVKLECD